MCVCECVCECVCVCVCTCVFVFVFVHVWCNLVPRPIPNYSILHTETLRNAGNGPEDEAMCGNGPEAVYGALTVSIDPLKGPIPLLAERLAKNWIMSPSV